MVDVPIVREKKARPRPCPSCAPGSGPFAQGPGGLGQSEGSPPPPTLYILVELVLKNVKRDTSVIIVNSLC